MKQLPLFGSFLLREITTLDAADIFHAIDNERLYLGRWLPFVEKTLRMDDTVEVVESMIAAEPYEYIFTIRDNECFVGLIGFKTTNRSTGSTEIGYWMREEYQGRGVVTRAVDTLCDFAFSELGLSQITIKCAVGNHRSSNIPKRLGFKFVETEKQAEILAGGQIVDIEVYKLNKKGREVDAIP